MLLDLPVLKKGSFYFIKDGETDLILEDKTKRGLEIRETSVDEKLNVKAAIYGHAGDGNLHPLILYDAQVPGEIERAIELGGKILRLCVEVGGTISGEHGVGQIEVAGVLVLGDGLGEQIVGHSAAAEQDGAQGGRHRAGPAQRQQRLGRRLFLGIDDIIAIVVEDHPTLTLRSLLSYLPQIQGAIQQSFPILLYQ